MPKIPYNKTEKSREDDQDYEIVSFEDFCDKSPGSKSDLLTLNDNINYRLCFESEKTADFSERETDTSLKTVEELNETSLNESKNNWKKSGTSSFMPFGRYNPRANRKGSLINSVIPKPKNDGDNSKEHRYRRFSSRRTRCECMCESLPGMGSSFLLLALVGALSVGVWWAVCGGLGVQWAEQHYRKLWERAHPTVQPDQPIAPYIVDKVLPEYRYHDHNNLSTKNKLNATENSRKKDLYKKSSTYTERPISMLNDLCAKVTENGRFDCFPQDEASEEACVRRGCCWKPASDTLTVPIGKPYCFYPVEYDSFHFLNMTENKHGMSVYYERQRPSGYPDDFDIARVDIKYISDDVLQIKISDAESRRFEPPYPEIPMTQGAVSSLSYRVLVDSTATGFKVVRNDDNVTIVDTQNVGGLILSDKFLQISSLLPTNKLYGLGERRGSFQVNMDWQSYTMFNFDTAPRENMNLYGTQPFYLALEDSGKAHGMLLLNSNAMDVIVQPTPAITYRTIGGVLALFVFVGPSPSHVVAQYTALVGRPFMPPYWALGFHLCKYNYGSLNVTEDVWQKNRDAGIPFDVQWNDLDYMNNSNDFTYDTHKFSGLPQFVKRVHNAGMHYIVLFDPGVSAAEQPGDYPPYDRGLELDIFVKNSSSLPFIAKVWNKVSTVYPDFTHPSATVYWVEMMTSLHEKVPFDGAWIDMNEPSNFVSGQLHGHCEPEGLPYKPRTIGGDGLKTKTLCMDARHYAGRHYDWHNLYSITEAIATHFALTEVRGKRPFIISRSTFVGIGQYAGHWSGDISSDWHDMAMTIPELLSFSLFGIPMMGADICGFNGNTTVELCKRWMQLGAFYPFSRNHNSDSSIPQDPVSLGEEVVAASREALRLKYTLLPYYYTLFWRAHVYGETVVRPLFFEFPIDQRTHSIDSQFLVGPSLLIAPILEPAVTIRRAYLPGASPWLKLVDETRVPAGDCTLPDTATQLVRSGSIIPLQEPPASGPVSTYNCRSNPMQLLAYAGNDGAARGALYWDDGDSLNSYEEKKYSHIEFSVKGTSLTSQVQWWGYGVPPVNKITLYGIQSPVKTVTLNGKPCNSNAYCTFSFDPKKQLLKISNMKLSLMESFELSWTYKSSLKAMLAKGGRVERNETLVMCKNNDCSDIEKR